MNSAKSRKTLNVGHVSTHGVVVPVVVVVVVVLDV